MKKSLIAFAALFAAVAIADTALGPIVVTGHQLKRGSSNVGTPHATQEACIAAARADAEARKAAANYSCNPRINFRVTYSKPVPPPPPPPPPPPMGNMPFVDATKIPAPNPGFSVERAKATTERLEPSDIGAFRTACDYSHMNFDDALVYPGQKGASHLHVYFGNTGADYRSTAESIAATGNSTCRGGILNRSAYWVPAMIDTKDGTPIKPKGAGFYYKTGYSLKPGTLQVPPIGLRMIAGDMKNSKEEGPFWYDCHGPGPSIRDTGIPNCPVGYELVQQIVFPQCWDGKNLDSPDHKSHMAYPVGSSCPASHPVPIPEITFNIHYSVTEANSTLRWRLSSDMYSNSLKGGLSSHGDWINGWRPDAIDSFTKKCDNAQKDCKSHLLGDGREIY